MEQLKSLQQVIQPDVRSDFLATTLNDCHREASGAELNIQVPEKIRTHFATAQNLAVYAWFFYPFHMSAQMHALASVEFALRERLDPKTRTDAGFRRMLERAVKHRLVKDDGFKLFPVPAPNQPREIMDGKVPRIVNSFAEMLVVTFPGDRNDLAHGSTQLHWDSATTLRLCADVINQLFQTSHLLSDEPPAPLPAEEIDRWLTDHVPYRVVAAASMSPVEQEWEPGPLVLGPPGKKAIAFNYAALQGRRAAIRWLIEFVGLKQDRQGGRPEPSDPALGQRKGACGVGQLGGKFMEPDATNPDVVFLANIWMGCTLAILHPTRNTSHFDVEHENLNRAVAMLIAHLDGRLYRPLGRDLKATVAEYCRQRI